MTAQPQDATLRRLAPVVRAGIMERHTMRKLTCATKKAPPIIGKMLARTSLVATTTALLVAGTSSAAQAHTATEAI